MNGGSGTGDGRLDLDDLGEVIDAATTVGTEARAEVLDDGRGRTWGDRFEEAGITPWLRRHRVAVAATAGACVIVGGAAAAYVRWAPPPFDTQLRVTVTQLPPELEPFAGDVLIDPVAGGTVADVDGHARTAYGLTPTDPDDTARYAVLGIAGPAVRASSTHPHSVDSTPVPVASNVDVIVDCSDPDALDPADGSYSLRVSRTDAWGRTLVASVVLPDGAAGWPTYVTSRCANQLTPGALDLQAVTVRPGPRPASVSVELDVVNTLPVDVAVTVPEEGGYPSVSSRLAETAVVAGGSARLPLVLEVHDCAAPALYPIGVEDPDDQNGVITAARPGSFLVLELMTQSSRSGASPHPRGGSPVYWSESTAREIDSALRASCAGAPATPPTVRIVDAGPSDAVVESFPSGNGTADTAAYVVLAVATTGSRVAVVDPAQPAFSYVGSYLSPATGTVIGGRATLQTTWSYDCSGGGYAPPPTIELVVSTPGGDFPFRTQLSSGALTRAIIDGCTNTDEQQLVDSGYEPPVARRMTRSLIAVGA